MEELNYKKAYLVLFNTLSDICDHIENGEYGLASLVAKEARAEAEKFAVSAEPS